MHCRKQLVWYDNIPVASFVLLRGKCRYCHKHIPASYFWVELCAGLLLVLVAFVRMQDEQLVWLIFLRDVLFLGILIVTFVYDYKYMEVLTGVAWSGAMVGFVFNYFFLGYPLQSLLIGMVVGGGFFLMQYLISKGRWVGGGDVRLGIMIGAWLGWPLTLLALLLSYVFGALVAIPLLVTQKKAAESELAFGTFLAIGTFITLFWGQPLLDWYLRLIAW